MRHKKNITNKPEGNLKSATVRLTEEQHRQLKAEAAVRGLTIQQVLQRGWELALAQADRGKN